MDTQADGWRDWQRESWTDGKMDGLTDRLTNLQTDHQMDIQMDKFMRDRRTDAQIDPKTDIQKDRLMDRRTGRQTYQLIDGQTNTQVTDSWWTYTWKHGGTDRQDRILIGRRTDPLTDKQMDRPKVLWIVWPTDWQTDGWTYGQTDTWTNRSRPMMDRLTDGWTNGLTERHTDRPMDGQTNRLMDR